MNTTEVEVLTKDKIGTRLASGVVLGIGVALVGAYLAAGFVALGTKTQTAGSTTSPANSYFVTTEPHQQWHPVMSGNTIVWMDYRNSDESSYGQDLYAYNIKTRQEWRVTQQPTADGRFWPSIDGDRVVWSDIRNGNEEAQDIYMYTFSTGQEERLTNSAATEIEPTISGNKVIWVDSRNEVADGGADLFAMDLTTRTEVPLVVAPGIQEQPDLQGNVLVWNSAAETDGGLYVMDLATGTRTHIAGANGYSWPKWPKTDGKTVVWMQQVDELMGNEEVFSYTIATNEKKQITNHADDQWLPDVNGNIITWMDMRNGDWEIYTYNLANGKESRLTSLPSTQAEPRFAWPWMVWMDDRNGNGDIFLAHVNKLVSPGTMPNITAE